MIRRFLALLIHGSELAVDPRWRELHRAEHDRRRAHGRVNEIRKAKSALVHSALRKAVQGRGA